VRIALRLGLYQLRFLTRIPASAAVNEAVELVRFARLRSAEKFVNAVLRRSLREPDFDPTVAFADPCERLAIETSHPSWLIKRWHKAFGADEASALARANNEPAPVSFRLTGHENDQADILVKLETAGAVLVPSKVATNAWRITGGTEALRALMESGQVYLQDEGSQLVSHLLAPQASEYILDVCSAPGSKATHLAALANEEAVIVAGDFHERRLQVVAKSARSQKLSQVHCVGFDALEPLPFRTGVFDRVLVDAPCSGTGTLRRNPEIRWRIRPEDIRELSGRQKQLLSRAARMVKPGGRLAYSTCSVELEENEEVVNSFLEAESSFVRLQPTVDPSLMAADGTVRTWPHRQGTDGFFITVFESKVQQ
jgi:16S rRNA (cytosine967-C5)-methyltransferase